MDLVGEELEEWKRKKEIEAAALIAAKEAEAMDIGLLFTAHTLELVLKNVLVLKFLVKTKKIISKFLVISQILVLILKKNYAHFQNLVMSQSCSPQS